MSIMEIGPLEAASPPGVDPDGLLGNAASEAGNYLDSLLDVCPRRTMQQVVGDVVTEHANGRRLDDRSINWLRENGVPTGAWISDADGAWNEIRLDRVVRLDSRTFEFSRYARDPSDGFTAFTVVARNRAGDPVDVVAWAPRRGALLSWLGALPVLGAETLGRLRLDDDNLNNLIVDDPLDWLRLGRTGALVLDWQAAGPMLRDEGRLEVLKLDTGRRLLEAVMVTPRIFMRRAA
ncbi:hypothetical protein WDZ92_19610 [Nostoc sp. NIES-2111]